ncbi:hypothetical protein EV207_1731 [Scopulibacillus darangshiensis]|uniref:Helix-turn-helix protein n=1 Tax=Scopulibacillus darangshiensis TaxID=442528 RepID=A0A4R2NAR4_9BACL|nr:hypothetical protein [Scopulibacillus darangshiensis]TCP18022.1 hypothetical protein EV207_1731 [Scopulibacillus darangshiensis]
MDIYNVDQAFMLLKQYKLTTHKESVRRWLRNGILKGIPPQSKKGGWHIKEADLWVFIRERTPDVDPQPRKDPEAIRSAMWWEIVRKNIFEGFIEIKKSDVKTCIEQNRQSKAFERDVWENLRQNKRGYMTPRIPYLLDACLYDGQRIKMDNNFSETKDQILFAVIEHLRQEKVYK